MELKPFELSIPRSAKLQIDTHSPNECGSTYPSSRLDPAAFNPIMGTLRQQVAALWATSSTDVARTDIVIHPPNPLNLSSTPHYTLIRLSATSSNTNWLETKHALASSTDDQMPQWALNLSHLLEVKVPQRVNLLQRGTGFDDDEDSAGSVSGDEYDDPDLDDDDEDELGLEPKDGADELEVYPHRFRLWAMAASSGGGVTAVLVTRHNTQRPERQAWHVLRSMVYFEHQSRSRRRRSETQTGDWSSPAERSLSTEGRMFEWMYGQGPGVPTLTMPAAGADLAGAGVDDDDGQATARREIIRVLIEAQQCEVCGAAVQPSQDTTGLTVCTNGHRFGPCGSTGLAVQQPGIARTCGVCGMRTIRVQELVRKMPERRAEILRVGQDLCGRCGGKFLN